MAVVNHRDANIDITSGGSSKPSIKSSTIGQNKSSTKSNTSSNSKSTSSKKTETYVLDSGNGTSNSQNTTKELKIGEKELNSVISTLELTRKDLKNELDILKKRSIASRKQAAIMEKAFESNKFPKSYAEDFKKKATESYKAYNTQKDYLSASIQQFDDLINNVNDKKKTLTATNPTLIINKNDYVDNYIEYLYTLQSNGIIDKDISRVLRGKITIENLMVEIENDPNNSRRQKILESSYLQACGLNFLSMEDFNNEIAIINAQIEVLQKQKIYLESGEIEGIVNIVQRLQAGENLDSILSTYLWQYTDKNGNISYRWDNPNSSSDQMLSTDTYTPVTLESVYKDSKLLEELKSVLSQTNKKYLFGKEKTVYSWEGTETQTAYFQSLINEYNNIKEAKANNLQQIQNLQNQLSSYQYIYSTINSEVSHYMNNVDKYIKKEDFNSNNNFNTSSLNIMDSIDFKRLTSNYGSSNAVFVTDKDAIDIVSCIINNKFNIDGTTIPNYAIHRLQSKGDIIEHYYKWAEFITDDEIEIFNYIYNTEGSEGAYKYLEDISNELDNRWLENKRKEDQTWASENKFLSSVASIFVTPIEGLSAACYSLNSYFTGEKIRRTDVYSAGDVWRSKVSTEIAEKYGEGWAFAYNTGMSMADSASLIGLNIMTGGTATPVISAVTMGSRAYASTLNDALDRGLSDGQAITLAFSNAAVETAMESISVGHLMNLEGKLGESTIKLINNVANNISNETTAKIATKGLYIFANALSQGICEGEEEFATEIANYALDIFIAKDLSNYNKSIEGYLAAGYSEDEALAATMKDFAGQSFQAFLGGFTSGICFGSLGGGTSTMRTSYGIANNMYGEFQGKTNAQQFVEALKINQSQIQQYEDATKVKDGVLTSEQLELLLNGTVEQQAGKALKDNAKQKIIDVFTNNNSSSNNGTSNINIKETVSDNGRELKDGERLNIGFQFFANSDTTGIVKDQSISSNSTTSNIDYLTAEISKANYYTGKGNFYTIDVDSFDSIPSDFWSKIDDPSSVQFRKDGQIYSYLDAKELSGAYSLSGMNTSTTRTLDQEIANANYYTGKGNSYTIDVDSFDSIPSDFWSKIDDPSSVQFRKDGKVYSSADVINIMSIETKTNSEQETVTMKDEILSNMPQGLDALSKVRYLYLELNKRISYELGYFAFNKLGESNLKEAYYSQNISFDNLQGNKVICKGWSQLFEELLLSAGFDPNAVSIKGSEKNGAHKWVEIEFDSYIIRADATDGFNHTIDLSTSKSGSATNGFIAIDKSLSGVNINTKNSNGIRIYDTLEINNDWLRTIDENLGYCKNGKYFNEIVGKLSEDFYSPSLVEKIFGVNKEKALSTKYDYFINLSISENMNSYDASVYFNQTKHALFNDSELKNISTALYCRKSANSSVPVGAFSILKFDSDGSITCRIIDDEYGEYYYKFNNMIEYNNYIKNYGYFTI